MESILSLKGEYWLIVAVVSLICAPGLTAALCKPAASDQLPYWGLIDALFSGMTEFHMVCEMGWESRREGYGRTAIRRRFPGSDR